MAITASINDSLDNTTVGEPASEIKTKSQNSDDIKGSFLKLLIAQLKNQDPTNPIPNSEVTSQIAQISTVEGIETLNKTLGSIVGQMGNNQAMQTTLLIGREVMIPGDKILVGSSEEKGISITRFGLELSQPADSVKVKITEKSGAMVQELNLGQLGAGVHTLEWDGKDADGKEVESGAYNFTVSASNKDGQLMATSLTYAEVQGVIRDKDGTKLDLGLAADTVTMDKVRQIL
ncbi:flagellar hook assembly protein FlgD [Xenorhabdus sp. PB62.4]|uniref:flagellar hook assembly protein FlgD n=1 Tax=Xenorhabdus sp. PB62.4 TaxID=1851573 RepID=UPI00165707C8|nr:flagellar hook assembly protein FlgD [Xenorhabdus sp. PB62.4]MBC8953478.1 flagellar basal body rod modification protein [Xenorhabdus sp. PB62.4]